MWLRNFVNLFISGRNVCLPIFRKTAFNILSLHYGLHSLHYPLYRLTVQVQWLNSVRRSNESDKISLKVLKPPNSCSFGPLDPHGPPIWNPDSGLKVAKPIKSMRFTRKKFYLKKNLLVKQNVWRDRLSVASNCIAANTDSSAKLGGHGDCTVNSVYIVQCTDQRLDISLGSLDDKKTVSEQPFLIRNFCLWLKVFESKTLREQSL